LSEPRRIGGKGSVVIISTAAVSRSRDNYACSGRQTGKRNSDEVAPNRRTFLSLVNRYLDQRTLFGPRGYIQLNV
jgi:hypothetical protein